MLIKFIEKIGETVIEILETLGRIVLFFLIGSVNIFVLPFQWGKIIDHTWFVGTKSIFVIALTGLFTGMVLGLQGYYSLVKFGSEAALGSAVALTLIRELGPVFTAIMITARAGSAMTAEIGVMRISEQIDALKTMHINPVRFMFTPRIVAAIISFPLLTALFDVIGILGGYISGSVMLGINRYVYMDTVIKSVELSDINGGFYKALVFSIVVTTICCYRGYYTHLYSGFGAKGVSLSTTNAVVQSCIFVLVFDYIITFFTV
ncbi:MAG: ABC transporter permease [Proteobacteria bacterium]|nr:ABC transporter permease [Pseudomonadota bacterium]MBU1582791.1 ABC transporter permease [Pseudomonadota bacterium]MBU2454126.1 ABC transporter permease [Pseudomonadota bacterium]MBU2628199.1 ABC transporter permease [Pseudomonadota bacterium]